MPNLDLFAPKFPHEGKSGCEQQALLFRNTSLIEFLKAKKKFNHVSSSKVIEYPTKSSRMCAPWWIESHDKNSQPRS